MAVIIITAIAAGTAGLTPAAIPAANLLRIG
jgi:hypothetical protein